ncbi:MAG TPA: SIS domain-containing protein [Thermomicrobiales bacterium]|nr:SIS domain-containing protein [Thermomicrobiales bacterium]
MHEVASQNDHVVAVAPTAAIEDAAVAHQVDVLLHERLHSMAGAVACLAGRSGSIAAIASALVTTLRTGGKVLVAGNGGSAAEAQHFAGELVGRFLIEREAYAAIALCVDSAVVTAIANDYGYDNVFARQVQGLGRPGDLFLAISTSGSSTNLIRAANVARDRGLRVAAITGDRANPLEEIANYTLRIPATSTPLVQELQMMVTHILCGIAETEMSSRADVNGERRRG